MQTRNQEIAADVFNRVNEIKQNKEEYKSMADKLPVLVQTAGLAQALSFVEARGTETQKQLLKDLSETLKKVVKIEQLKNQSLPEYSRETTSLQEYLHLTRQVMVALLWYKRFASSVLDN
jgi:CRISPR-associated protein Cmr5